MDSVLRMFHLKGFQGSWSQFHGSWALAGPAGFKNMQNSSKNKFWEANEPPWSCHESKGAAAASGPGKSRKETEEEGVEEESPSVAAVKGASMHVESGLDGAQNIASVAPPTNRNHWAVANWCNWW